MEEKNFNRRQILGGVAAAGTAGLLGSTAMQEIAHRRATRKRDITGI